METIDGLIRALNGFSGGVLIVSHDEHLISTVCDQIWICENKHVTPFIGDFDDYRDLLAKTDRSFGNLRNKRLQKQEKS